jgi:hypothetical protein
MLAEVRHLPAYELKKLVVLNDPQVEVKALPNFRLSEHQLRDPCNRATPQRLTH